jgi:hypothetical protein
MRALLCFSLFVLISMTVFAQAPKKLSLNAYLKAEGYVRLMDRANLPPVMLPYYKQITDTLTKKQLRLTSFFVKKNSITDNISSFNVTIYPIDGIKLLKDTEDRQREENYQQHLKELKDPGKEHVQIIDDIGGSLGELGLSLNKVTNVITMYQYQ